jgi:hypothetical protein
MMAVPDWQPKFDDLENITDAIGRGLDPGIKRTVLAVQLMGLETYFSCEGHFNRGLVAPVIRFRCRASQIRDIQRQWIDSFSEVNPYSRTYDFDSGLVLRVSKQSSGGEISSLEDALWVRWRGREYEACKGRAPYSNPESKDVILPYTQRMFIQNECRRVMSDFTDFVLDTLFEGNIPQPIQDLPRLRERPLDD